MSTTATILFPGTSCVVMYSKSRAMLNVRLLIFSSMFSNSALIRDPFVVAHDLELGHCGVEVLH